MYLEIDEGYFEHPKTLDLCARLQDSKACVYPLRLWKWACRSAKSGKLGKISAFAMEKAVDYEPMDGKCFDAMCLSGFMDAMPDGTFEIHDWMDYTGGALKRMEDKAAENRRRREEGKRRYEAGQSKQRTGIVPVQSENRTGTNPTQTRPDQTSQDKTSPGDPPARDPGTTDTDVETQPEPLDNGPFLPTTPSRLKCCLDAAMQKRRPERCPYSPGQWWDREAGTLLRDLGDPEKVAPEILRRIGLFVADDRMAPWTVKRFCAEYNGIGVSRVTGVNRTQEEPKTWKIVER